MTKYWVTIMAHGVLGYFPLGIYIEFDENTEHIDEKSVRAKIVEYFEKEREAGKSSFTFGITDTVLAWSKCE